MAESADFSRLAGGLAATEFSNPSPHTAPTATHSATCMMDCCRPLVIKKCRLYPAHEKNDQRDDENRSENAADIHEPLR